MPLHARFTAGYAPLLHRLGYAAIPKPRDARRFRNPLGGFTYPDSYGVRRRYKDKTWGFTSEGILGATASVGLTTEFEQDMLDAAGIAEASEYYVSEFGQPPPVQQFTANQVAFYITGTNYDGPYHSSESNWSWPSTGAQPLLSADGNDFVSNGGGLIIILRGNARKAFTSLDGSVANIPTQTVWRITNAFPSSGPGSHAWIQNTCDIGCIHTIIGAGPIDQGATQEVDWGIGSESHPIINGPYGNFSGSANHYKIPAGEYARMFSNGSASFQFGETSGVDRWPLIMAQEKGKGRLIVVAAQDVICTPPRGGGFIPFQPARYSGRSLLKNMIAWVSRASPLPADATVTP